MKTPLSLVRCDEEIDIRLTGRELEAVSLGLRTLLITMTRDEALCGAASAGLSKLPGVVRSYGQRSALGGDDMPRRIELPITGLSRVAAALSP